jgi:DNA-binding XRE family transcriptional regulator
LEEDEPDLETAFKVIAIMQTITEDLDESGKRMWRKMLGLEQDESGQRKHEQQED